MSESRTIRLWLSPQDVGVMVGFSANFIRLEIKAQALPAQFVPSRSRKTGRWRIHRDDAKAYAVKLGVWREVRTS
jgi:hypothetical protein